MLQLLPAHLSEGRDADSAQTWETLGWCSPYPFSILPCPVPRVQEAVQDSPKLRLKTGSPAQDHQVTWVHLHSDWDLLWPPGLGMLRPDPWENLGISTFLYLLSNFLCFGDSPHPQTLVLRSYAF